MMQEALSSSTFAENFEKFIASTGSDDALVVVPLSNTPPTDTAGILDWKTRGLLSRLILNGFITSKPEDFALVPVTISGKRMILLCLEDAYLSKSANLKALGLKIKDLKTKKVVFIESTLSKFFNKPEWKKDFSINFQGLDCEWIH